MVRAMRAALLAIAGAVVAVAFGAPAHAEWGAYCSENYPIAPPGAICTPVGHRARLPPSSAASACAARWLITT